MIETEIKYLLKDSFDIKSLTSDLWIKTDIQQGYLMTDRRTKRQLRVRIQKRWYGQVWSSSSALVAFKSPIDKYSKYEFEFKTTINSAKELLLLCECKLVKTRYTQLIIDHSVSIDIYSDGTKIVEVEGDDPESFKLDYLGEDITNNDYYSNIEIAKRLNK